MALHWPDAFADSIIGARRMLEDSRVRLEPLDPSEVSDQHVAWLNDPATFEFLGSKFGQTRASVQRYVDGVQWPNTICRIVRRADDVHVGNIALQGFDAIHRRMELGIVIGRADARGQGLGRSACSLLIEFAFDHLNLHKVTAGTVAENEAMTAVFLALGFSIEGSLKQHYYLRGGYRDVQRFGLLRDAFRPVHR